MASFGVAWSSNNCGRSKLSPVENLEELQGCLGHTQSLRPGIMYRKNFLNYKSRNHEICKTQKINAVVVNKFAEISRMDSSSKSGEPSSVFNNVTARNADNPIYPQKRMIDKEQDVSRKFDQWVKDSVVEILNNLDEAPFLMLIYSDGEEASLSTKKNKLVKEKAAPESWPLIKERWGGGMSAPSGIILVEEMNNNEAADCTDAENWKTVCESNKPCSSTKVWGILIQGKGANYPACYILKTNRVPCLAGFCTHFCLRRVESFVEHVDIQFKKLWLL